MKPLETLLVFARSAENSTFSYQQAWPRHFAAHPAFRCVPLNVADRRWTARLRRGWVARRFRGDLVVLLHSAFSNACMVPDWLIGELGRLPQPKVFFIGNEYKLMPEKMAFGERLGLALLVSQSQSPAVHDLYRRRLGCAVIGVPNTGVDPALFRPERPIAERPIDLGYRADDAPPYLGHRERREIAEFFQARAAHYGLTVDISLDPSQRFDERGWAAFLNRCKGQLGTEAGGDCFELDDRTRRAVIAFLAEQPDAGFEAVYARFFAGRRDCVPLRILSGRHVEAAATGTVQLLFAGHYDGFFRPDEHYIALRKDFADVDDALAKFRDAGFREGVAARAGELARAEFTYDRLIDRFRASVQAFV